MAKTHPLVILLYPPCDRWVEWQAVLTAKGHRVLVWPALVDTLPDLVLGANCWRMTDDLEPYKEVAVTNARKGIK